jgi:ribosome biogenesis GTPase A
MPIHWFPGHMATARREIRKAMPEVSLVIEVVDARIPFSSENPLVAELRGDKPRIQILNKADLADPAVTALWLAATAASPRSAAITHSLGQSGILGPVMSLARSMVPLDPTGPMVAMIVGIPNVGKSTLINTLAGRIIAKTGNKPAVTQMQQRVRVSPALVLLDTPGFLWHKLSPEACGYRLAVTGAISDRVVDYRDIAGFAARFLRERYPDALATAYGITEPPLEDEALLEAIGRRRGFLVKGGGVDLQRAAERLIQDLRAGVLGRISLETPADASG